MMNEGIKYVNPRHRLIFLFLLAFLYVAGSRVAAQEIRGMVADEKSKPVGGALVRIFNRDSVFLSGASADEEGKFRMNVTYSGKIIIRVSFLGYQDLLLYREIKNVPLDLGRLVLKEKSSAINEVTITGQTAVAQQKGDTTQFNAGSYKTNPDASAEDLVGKMPGITNENGKLKAQGEDVKQVLVDGKPFFGEDPSAVLKNLPAEVIDKIQVFDRKSDQSQITGFDDGNTSKTLNIITKTQFRNGTFGKIYSGYGLDDKWKAGYSLNFFKDKRRITILANTNNINEQNFTAEDLAGVMSGSSGGPGRQGQGGFSRDAGRQGGGRQGGGGDAGNFLVDQKNGITTTRAIGLNYNNSWKKLDISASYFLNNTENNSVSNLNRHYISVESRGLSYAEQNSSVSRNTNHRLSMRFDWKINTNNSILFQPRVSLQHNTGNSLLFGQNTLSEKTLSTLNNTYNTLFDAGNASANLIYRHGFAKKGRALSVFLTPTFNFNRGNSDLKYDSYRLDSLPSDTVSQTMNLDKNGNGMNSSVSYAEPINSKSQVLFTISFYTSFTDSRKKTVDNTYSEMDTSLSSYFKTNYQSQSAGLTYRYQEEKWNMTAGFSLQNAILYNQQTFPAVYTLDKSFFSMLPTVVFQYKFNPQKNLRVNYHSYNTAPTVDQLQNVINNRNPLQLTTGNPNLRQDWQNNLNLRYTAIDAKANTAFFALLGGTIARNYMVNSSYIAAYDTLLAPSVMLSRGSQISRPANLNGYYNVRTFVNYSFPLNTLKSKLNISFSGNQNRTPALINSKVNYALSSGMGVGFTLSSNISEKLDFSVSSNSNVSRISNSLQSSLNSSYFNQNSRFRIQANPWKGLILQTDLSHQYYNGLTASYNQNYTLWNAAIGYKFLKNRVADIRFSVFDLLKQNNSISRNTAETYYEDVQTRVLQRYYMLTFTYNLRFYKDRNSQPDKNGDKK